MILKNLNQKKYTENISFFLINLFIISNLIFWDFTIFDLNIKNFYLIFFLSFFFINKKVDIKKFTFLLFILGIIIFHSLIENIDSNRLVKVSILFYLTIFFIFFNFDKIKDTLGNCIIYCYYIIVSYFFLYVPIKLLQLENFNNLFDFLFYKFSIYCNGLNINSLNLIFSENSHLGMIFPALHLYYILKTKNNLYLFIFLNVLTILIIILFNSLTMFMSYFIFFVIYFFLLIFKKLKTEKKTIFSIFVIFSIVLFFMLSFQGCKVKFFDIFYSYLYKKIDVIENVTTVDKLNNKNNIENKKFYKNNEKINNILNTLYENVKNHNNLFEYDEEKAIKFQEDLAFHHPNVSSLTYVKHARLTLIALKDKPFGWGLNNYGLAFFKYSDDIEMNIANHFRNRHMFANYNDGASNLFKLLVEFGILNIFIFFTIFKFFKSDVDIYLKIFLTGLTLTTFVRGAGYFNASFLFCIVLITMMTYKKFRLFE